jgi:GNAT superfamily N-acetyltransferase
MGPAKEIPMDIQTRKATLADLERLVSFAVAEANEAEGITKTHERVRKGIKAGLCDDSVAIYWVLEKGGAEVIGNVSVVKEWSNWNAGYYWWIQSIYVLPTFRGRGLMQKLIQTVKQAAIKEKVLDLRLYVHNANKRAIRAYRKTGFSDSEYKIMRLGV